MYDTKLLQSIDALFKLESFSLDKETKAKTLQLILSKLNYHHYQHDEAYRNSCKTIHYNLSDSNDGSIEKHPFLPVSLFKSLNLKSIPPDEVYKTIYSSGTSIGKSSVIYLDKQTALLQQKALVKIVSDFTGLKRSPMLMIDKPAKNAAKQAHTSVRTAVLGFSLFASEICYALDDNMNLRLEAVQSFIKRNNGKVLIVFGFTFQVWLSLVAELKKLNSQLDLSHAVLIHGGGWKKALEQAVTPAEFKMALHQTCNLQRLHNYYGMIEQSGNVLLECEAGYLHSSIYGDVLIRNPLDFSVCKPNEPGIIQVMYTLALSYCGHNLLTGDEGVLRGEDDCKCGRKGKYIEVMGRFPAVAPKGCSDV